MKKGWKKGRPRLAEPRTPGKETPLATLIRVERGVSAPALAERANCSKGSVYSLFEGIVTPISVNGTWKKAATIQAAALGVNPEELWPDCAEPIRRNLSRRRVKGLILRASYLLAKASALGKRRLHERAAEFATRLEYPYSIVATRALVGDETLATIGSEFGLSRESVRQKRDLCIRCAEGRERLPDTPRRGAKFTKRYNDGELVLRFRQIMQIRGGRSKLIKSGIRGATLIRALRGEMLNEYFWADSHKIVNKLEATWVFEKTGGQHETQ